MPIKFSEENDGNLLILSVSGELVKSDYASFEQEFERLLRSRGKLRLLMDIADVQGWDAGAAWEDLKFDIKHFADIERLAIVGDKSWQHGMAVLFQPFTKATMRYFDRADVAKARHWLQEM